MPATEPFTLPRTFEDAARLRRKLSDEGVDDSLSLLIYGQATRLVHTEEALVNLGESLARKLTQAVAVVKAGEGHVNSLGELQGSGVEFDRLCSVRYEQREALSSMVGAAYAAKASR